MKKSKFMFFSMCICIVLTMVILVLSCVHMFIDKKYDMGNWLMTVCLGIFAVVQIVCLCTQKFHWKKIGFYLLHIGLVLVLIGCFMYFVKGEKYQLTFPVSENFYKVGTSNPNEEPLDLLMDIRVLNTKTEYYSPTYSVYRYHLDSGERELLDSDLEIEDGALDLSAYGGRQMSEAELAENLSVDPSNGAVYYYLTSDTAVIQTLVPSHFEVNFLLYSVPNKEYYGTEENPLTLTVNHPIVQDGWKIYLMRLGSANGMDYAIFTFKKDPGEWVTVAGIVLLIAGTFISCFVRTGAPKKEETVAGAATKPVKKAQREGKK